MPRPGPRPYECIRRAWHSDRHQPIRGSIIQQIFRVINEAHSSKTRKNSEWQEKLPRVVFKAEEILYSKADSEAEYVNADTLLQRLNDAIDTIIRRDESTETGQYLQPCIEAALVLGCVPVKASRSQRHSNPRNYLNPRFQETAQAPAVIPNKINHHVPFSRPPPSGNQLSTPRSGMANQASPFEVSSSQISPTTSYTATQNVHQYQQSAPRPICPLYRSSHFPNVESTHRFHSFQYSYSDNIIIGRPVGWPRGHPPFSNVGNTLPGKSAGNASNRNERVRPLDSYGKTVEMGCDLSLRLGPSDCCASVENNDCGSSSQHEVAKNVELSLFPTGCIGSDPFESCDKRLNQEEHLDKNSILGKRKVEDYHELRDATVQRPPHQHNQFDGQSRWPDCLPLGELPTVVLNLRAKEQRLVKGRNQSRY